MPLLPLVVNIKFRIDKFSKKLKSGVYAKESVHESPSVGDTGRETHTRNHALAG